MKKELRAEARAKKADAKKKAETADKLKIGALIAIPVLVIIAVIVVAFVARDAYSLKIDYAEGITANGKLTGINPADYVEVCDYNSITVPKSEVEMSEEKVSEHLESLLTEYKVEEITDEFIVENFADTGATTVDSYLEYIKSSTMEENIKDYLYEYILLNSTVKSYPKSYLKIMEDRTDKQYVSQYQYYNELLYMYTGSYQWNSYLEYYNVSRSEYKDMVKTAAKDAVKEALVLQQIADELSLNVTNEDLLDIVESLGYTADDEGLATAKENYSEAYLQQIAANNKVIEYLSDKVTVE